MRSVYFVYVPITVLLCGKLHKSMFDIYIKYVYARMHAYVLDNLIIIPKFIPQKPLFKSIFCHVLSSVCVHNTPLYIYNYMHYLYTHQNVMFYSANDFGVGIYFVYKTTYKCESVCIRYYIHVCREMQCYINTQFQNRICI